MGFQSSINQALGTFGALGAFKGIQKEQVKTREVIQGMSDAQMAAAQSQQDEAASRADYNKELVEKFNLSTKEGGATQSSPFGESTGIFEEPETQSAFASTLQSAEQRGYARAQEEYNNKITMQKKQNEDFRQRVQEINNSIKKMKEIVGQRGNK